MSAEILVSNMAISHLLIWGMSMQVYFVKLLLAASVTFVLGCSPLSHEPALTSDRAVDLRLEMAQHIVNFEARRDRQGRLIVYRLPRGDGGGRFEVAGINERFHRATAIRLRGMIERGQHAQAETEAVSYIASKTDFPAREARNPAIQFLLRDIAWNRGPTGAVRTLQIALGATVDGKVGPQTRHLLAEAEQHPEALIISLRHAREAYERRTRDECTSFWEGLVNRWNNAGDRALGYMDPPKSAGSVQWPRDIDTSHC